MPAKLTNRQFIERANRVHFGFYEYDEKTLGYTNLRKHVNVTCPVHGPYQVIAGSHLSGTRCKQCSINSKRLSQDQFLNRAVEAHGSRYDYSMTDYQGRGSSIDIICPTHGLFNQNAGSHLDGHGCPKCYGRHSGKVSLYWVCIAHAGSMYLKIGITKKANVADRFTFRSDSSEASLCDTFGTVEFLDLEDARKVEKQIHTQLKPLNLKLNGFSGKTECYSLESYSILEKVFASWKGISKRRYITNILG